MKNMTVCDRCVAGHAGGLQHSRPAWLRARVSGQRGRQGQGRHAHLHPARSVRTAAWSVSTAARSVSTAA